MRARRSTPTATTAWVFWGRPWPDARYLVPALVEHKILRPLGLRDTRVGVEEADLPTRRAVGAFASGEPSATWHGAGYAPAGVGAWSTSADLADFLDAVLRGAAPGVDAATPRFPAGGGERIGSGWITESADGVEVTWHNGGTGGFRSFVGFDRARQRASVVLGQYRARGRQDRPGAAARRDRDDACGERRPAQRPRVGNWLAQAMPALFFSLIGGIQLWLRTRRARVDRLQLADGAAWAIAMPALAYWTGHLALHAELDLGSRSRAVRGRTGRRAAARTLRARVRCALSVAASDRRALLGRSGARARALHLRVASGAHLPRFSKCTKSIRNTTPSRSALCAASRPAGNSMPK
jgi:hypothetical protein